MLNIYILILMCVCHVEFNKLTFLVLTILYYSATQCGSEVCLWSVQMRRRRTTSVHGHTQHLLRKHPLNICISINNSQGILLSASVTMCVSVYY